jgi:hypothetical protein
LFGTRYDINRILDRRDEAIDPVDDDLSSLSLSFPGGVAAAV